MQITDPHHHAVAGLEPELIPAERDHADTPVPYYIATGRALLMDVKKGTVLTWGMVDTDQASRIYQLRRENAHHYPPRRRFFVSGFCCYFGQAKCWSNIRFIGGIVTATLLMNTEMRLQDH